LLARNATAADIGRSGPPSRPLTFERAKKESPMMETRRINEQLEVDIREALGRVPSLNANGIGITADHRLVPQTENDAS